jgi:hypothetical protein
MVLGLSIRHQSCGNCQRYIGIDRHVRLAADTRVDRIFSAHHRADKRSRSAQISPRPGFFHELIGSERVKKVPRQKRKKPPVTAASANYRTF